MNESITGYEQKELKKLNPDYKSLYEFKARRCDNFARRLRYIMEYSKTGAPVPPRKLRKMARGAFTKDDDSTYKGNINVHYMEQDMSETRANLPANDGEGDIIDNKQTVIS